MGDDIKIIPELVSIGSKKMVLDMSFICNKRILGMILSGTHCTSHELYIHIHMRICMQHFYFTNNTMSCKSIRNVNNYIS